MERHKLKGCGTALLTPFDEGRVDMKAYERLVKRQVAAGIDFLVPLGTTAETPCLEPEEKLDILVCTRESASEMPLVVGAGTNSLRQTIKNMHLLSDADMYLIVVPFYNKPTQEGMYQYFKAVASETDKPIILYNVPGRTGTNMSAKTTLRLAEIDNIVGIKEASGNLSQVRTIIEGAPNSFSVLSGNDDQTLDIMLEGGDGVISVASNIVPEMMVNMVNAAVEYDFKYAAQTFRRLVQLFYACFVESNPIPAKAALSMLGLCKNEMRLPLTPAEPSTYTLMENTLRTLGII